MLQNYAQNILIIIHIIQGDCKQGFRADTSHGRLKCLPINLCIEFNTTRTSGSDTKENQINETLENSDTFGKENLPCNKNAKCEYTGPAQYRCICNDGYTGDGKECKRKHKY